MSAPTLSAFLRTLDQAGLLRRISAEVDPLLEVNAIVQELYRRSRASGQDAPALLFEKVTGSRFPLAVNLLGSDRGIELLLGGRPENTLEGLVESVRGLQKAAPQGDLLSWAWKEKALFGRLKSTRTAKVSSAPVQEVVLEGDRANLDELPILTCWPLDGGPFVTAGLVLTKSPKTGVRNIGIYRLQKHGPRELGLHWQIQKGGGFHYAEAEALGQPLEVAVVLGDPLLWLAGVLPLPENVDEIPFAGFLAGQSVPMVRCKTIGLEVPANAEIVIEGIARPGRRRPEGPFGDHFGHYSHQSDFPVLEVKCISHRRNAVYHAAVVGKPPQEDRALGETVTRTFLPVVKFLRPEIEDLWAHYETGFHNLLAVSVRQRYEKEAVKTALGLLGEGQLSLSKCVVLTDPGVDVRSFPALLRALRDHFRPEKDFILLPGTSQDTLDFTGPRINRGSKMILDATSKGKTERAPAEARPDLRKLDGRILGSRIWEDCLLAVQVKDGGREVVEKLVREPGLRDLKLIAAVSEDVPLEDDVLLVWGIFTRFDCESDLAFASSRLEGARPVHSGPMGIDATWKPRYPKPVETDPETADLVRRRWSAYGL